MKHAVEGALIERILGNLAAGRREMANGERQSPVDAYTSPQRHAAELSHLFRRHPVIVGPSSALPEPGTFLTHDFTGMPILAVRGADGQVRAFLNVCRHRGSRIVTESSGKAARAFVCPYHAWSYDLTGALTGVSDATAFAGLDRAAHGLVPLPAAERHGLIWVRPSKVEPGEAPLDIDAFLGPLASDFADFGLEGAALYAPVELPRAMNWKVMVDTFLEDYHFRWVHGQSVHKYYLDNASVYDRIGRHIRYVIPKRTLKDLAGSDPATWRLRDHSNILYYIFPNTVMVFVADHAAIFAMFPSGDANHSVMHLSFCLPEKPETEKAKAYWDKNASLIRIALNEDFVVGEGIQAGFASGANQHLTFGRYEKGLAFFHDIVEEAISGA
ncbi:MAG: aromatic ring-hydroxylating dioxygenase subunit alpha [Alphaproteobacteria bacterium]|nr:aromatic ring-hydroxylating dioxygenase subunit alpha [Alphaproteobacteria bacterium]